MDEVNFKDGFVQLFLNGGLKLEQAEVIGVTIGSKSEWIEVNGNEWVETKSAADYDAAYVGKDALLTAGLTPDGSLDIYNLVDVSVDGEIVVDDGGRIAGINLNGGTYSGAGFCDKVVAWCGAGICLSAMTADGDYFSGGMDEADARGAIFLEGATFSRCEVNPSNGFNGHGGAIKVYGGGTISAQDSLFAGNKANGIGQAGGALALVEFYGTSTITGSTFSGNEAYFGGAIQQNRGTMTVTGSLFAGNKTAGETTTAYPTGNCGGAIELHQGAKTTITGSTFTENAANSGGAIYNDTFKGAACEATVEDSVFEANTADYQGGAIYNYANMSVTGSVFTGNTVTDPDPYSFSSFGGAVVNTKNGVLTVSGSTFSANSAVQGGAIATFIDYGSEDTANLTVTDSVFSGNTTAYGGGIYIQTSTADMTTVSGTDFSGNTASYGGGAICECFGALTLTGGTFTANSAGNDGGAIAVWDSGNTARKFSGATFDANTALYGGAISHSWASAALTVSDCTVTANGGDTTLQGGAVWNDANSSGTVAISGSTFSGNAAGQGGAVYNAGNMKLENVTLATASDTVYNSGSLALAGKNLLGANVVNDGKITFSLASATDAVVDDLGKVGGAGTYLVKLNPESAVSGAVLAASAGTFSGSLSVKLGDVTSADSFTLKGGVIGSDLAVAGDTVLRLSEAQGVLSVRQETTETLVPAVSQDGSLIVWTDDAAAAGGYQFEIAQGASASFETAIRIATNGTGFDVAGRAGDYSCRAAEQGVAFEADATAWSVAETGFRQVESNANGRADIFFATVHANDVWSTAYKAKNVLTGEKVDIAGLNRIRDTFSGSASDANILYLSDTSNGDALFMDDVYSEFGEAARISLIREVRAGAGADVVDMTSKRYSAELAGMTVRGGAGDDVLWGAAGGNNLFGDAGNDRIVGGTGDDVIAGGSGDDTLTGCGGNDVFAFGENWGTDTVEQSAGGSVTLWFASGSETNWDAATLTYADGGNSVVVSGVAADRVTLKFGDDTSETFAKLSALGAFADLTSENVFEAKDTGIIASL